MPLTPLEPGRLPDDTPHGIDNVSKSHQKLFSSSLLIFKVVSVYICCRCRAVLPRFWRFWMRIENLTTALSTWLRFHLLNQLHCCLNVNSSCHILDIDEIIWIAFSNDAFHDVTSLSTTVSVKHKDWSENKKKTFITIMTWATLISL